MQQHGECEKRILYAFVYSAPLHCLISLVRSSYKTRAAAASSAATGIWRSKHTRIGWCAFGLLKMQMKSLHSAFDVDTIFSTCVEQQLFESRSTNILQVIRSIVGCRVCANANRYNSVSAHRCCYHWSDFSLKLASDSHSSLWCCRCCRRGRCCCCCFYRTHAFSVHIFKIIRTYATNPNDINVVEIDARSYANILLFHRFASFTLTIFCFCSFYLSSSFCIAWILFGRARSRPRTFDSELETMNKRYMWNVAVPWHNR